MPGHRNWVCPRCKAFAQSSTPQDSRRCTCASRPQMEPWHPLATVPASTPMDGFRSLDRMMRETASPLDGKE